MIGAVASASNNNTTSMHPPKVHRPPMVHPPTSPTPPTASTQSNSSTKLIKCNHSAGFGLLEGICVRLCRANSCGCSNEDTSTPLTHTLSCIANGECSVSSTTNLVQCHCNKGYDGGSQCRKCAKGFAGYPECILFTTCLAPCLNGGACDGGRGACMCPSSTNGGPSCATCASGYQSTGERCIVSVPSSIWGGLWFLVLLVLGCGLFAALVAVLYKRQKDRTMMGRHRTKYHGIPTDDLDESRFSFQEDGIDLIDGIGSATNSIDDVLIDPHAYGSSSDDGSDFHLSDNDHNNNSSNSNNNNNSNSNNNNNNNNKELDKGNDADVDDFRMDAEDGFEVELSDDEETGFAGW